MRPTYVLVLLLIGLPFAQAAEPAPRASPDMELDDTITAVAIAGDARSVVAGSVDPDDGSLGGNEDEDVWVLWDRRGDQLRSDDADRNDCGFGDDCRGDVVGVGISDGGNRIVIAANDPGAGTSLILFITPTQGEIQRITRDVPIGAIALNDAGTRLAVGFTVPGGFGSPATGRVALFTWGTNSGGGAGAVTEAWNRSATAPVTTIAIADDGEVAAGADDDHLRISAAGAKATDDIEESVRDVDMSATSSSHWSIAGLDNGEVLLYSDESDSAPFAPELSLKPSSSAQNAVAITDDGALFLSGGADGRLRLYANIFVLTDAESTLVQTVSGLDGAVADIAVSQDGRYAAVAAGDAAYLFRVHEDGLEQTWVHDHGATVNAVAISADGDDVVAASGNAVTVYPPTVDIHVTPPDPQNVTPGQELDLDVTYRNDGNREETLDLTLEAPTGWQPALGTDTLTLAPGEQATVNASFRVPDGAPPGDADISITHRLDGALPGLTALPVKVLQVRAWDLVADSSPHAGVEVGETATFDFTLTNTGNAEDTTSVEASIDRSGWSASVEPTSATLDPLQSVAVNLTVTAPSDAEEGATATVTLVLSADAGAKRTVTATVGADFRFSGTLAVLGGTAVQAGEPATLRVTVSNLGNTPDSYTVKMGALPSGWTVSYPGGEADLRFLAVDAARSATGDITIRPAADAAPANYQVRAIVTSLGDPGLTQSVQTVLAVEEAATSTGDPGGSQQTSAPGLVLLVAGLAAALLTRRR